MKLFFILIGLLTVFSCSQNIEIDQPYYEPKIVVDGIIESGATASVFLTKSAPFLTTYDSVSIRETFINYAKLTIFCSNGDSEVLILTRKNELFPPFVYKSVRMKGIVGETYTLKVEVEGKVITAVTTIPNVPQIFGLERVVVNDSACYYKIGIQPKSMMRYLFIQMKSSMADENFHPTTVPFYKIESSNESSRISLYRSDETNLYRYNRKNYPYSKWPSGMFSIKDTVHFKIGTIDVASYQVLKSLYADQSMKNNPFAFNSAGIQTNIIGGIGRWTGIGLSTTVESQHIYIDDSFLTSP